MPAAPTIVWLQRDLRLDDQPAIRAAIDRGGPVVPLYIWSPEEDRPWPPGAASRVWLHHSLKSLDLSLHALGSRLILRAGPILESLKAVIESVGAGGVVWSRCYEPRDIERDAEIETELRGAGLNVERCNSSLLIEPWELQTKGGNPYQVFTPFWHAFLAKTEPLEPVPAPNAIPAPLRWPESLSIHDLELLPEHAWHERIMETWRPGECGALAALARFLNRSAAKYEVERDRPDVDGTSRLSPHLHFGEISPRRIWHEAAACTMKPSMMANGVRTERGVEKFLSEIGWREFAHHLLYHFPRTVDTPLRTQFTDFPWRSDDRALFAWKRGLTGYPIVDGGMRQLWRTGWMHNRVRMLVASFLVKHLLISWTDGAAWFWDTLVDADLANNTLGWQWAAGCGADAAPYFRVFNPISQGEKFDPDGRYVRTWVPELRSMPAEFIHRPWDAPNSALATSGVSLGTTYPYPIVDHTEGRERALEALASIKRST